MAELIGARARKLRGKQTLEDVATAARSYGLRWSTGSVSDFESGKATPSLPTLLVVAAALGDAIGRPVSLTGDLLSGAEFVKINDTVGNIALGKLRGLLSEEPVRLQRPRRAPSSADRLRTRTALELVTGPPGPVAIAQQFRESDMRMCKNIGVSMAVGATAMFELWGRTFVAERDRLAGPSANAQRRGQISRQLKAELQKQVSNGNNQ
jgi:hypothetical protein